MILWEKPWSTIRHEPVFAVGRLLLGAIFLVASIDKIRYPHMFGEIVYSYQLMPDIGVSLVAVLLPWVELVLGIALIADVWTPGAVLLANLMLMAFLGLMAYNLARGLDVNCGCFSVQPADDPASLWSTLRDLAFLALAACLLLRTLRHARR